MYRGTDIDSLMPPEMIMHKVISIVAGLMLPAILIPIVAVFGFSEFFEEAAKALVVGNIILSFPRFEQGIFWTIFFGFSYGMSETVFYGSRIVENGNYTTLFERLIFTVPMHILTGLIIYLCGRLGKKYLIFGFILALATHLAFNFYITQLF